jgi:UDP:flavonoid glycosyltransferase YjiC (YdhE family)
MELVDLHAGAMRLLFTFTGGSGHFLPAIPIARAAMARGHEVLFSAQERMLSTVEAEGFPAIGSGGLTLTDPSLRGPLAPVDRGHEERVIRDVAGRIARERAARLLDVCDSWRPDVIVRDEVDFGAAVAAERLGLPHASIVVLAAGGLIRPDLVAKPLDALRVEHALPVDPHLEMLHRHLTLVPVPPTYRTPNDPLPAAARHIRPAVLDSTLMPAQPDASSTLALDWLQHRPGRPNVYFTLGTVFHQESGDLFTRVVAGLSDLDANIIVTVGREIDPAELGDQPANVRVDRFVRQQALLPHCDVVVSHGGSGSVTGALAFGVPLVLLPMGADQPLNADRCQALGVARVLDPITVSSGDIRLAVFDVLHTPKYRAAATRLQHETVELPTSADAATWIEALDTAHRSK